MSSFGSRAWLSSAACRAAVLVGVVTLGAAPVMGTPLVLNGSFENTTATTTSTWFCPNPTTCTVADWDTLDFGQLIVLPSWYTNGYLVPGVGVAGPLPQSSPDGGNFVFSDSDYHNSPITQTIAGLVPGDSYLLNFYQALVEDTEPNVTHPGPVSGEWQVSFGANTQSSAFMTGDGTTLTISPWALQTMTFTANTPTEVLSFFAVGAGDPPLMGLDGVSLEQVPEPASGALLLVGLLGFGVWYRRTRWQRTGC